MQSESGVTLIELLLVLIIALAIVLLGIRQYQMYRSDADVAEVKYTVDSLFRALGLYYQANCREHKDGEGVITKVGTLDPNHNPTPDDPFALDIEKDLNAPGYISSWPPNANPIVTAYFAQFNRADGIRNIYQCYKNPETNQVTCSEPQPSTENVVLWRAQIAVQLSEPEQANLWLHLLGATCISKAGGVTGTVQPCSETTGEGDYLVWEQLPSFGSANLRSDLWLSMQRLKQINPLYTNADLDAFNQFPWAIPPATYYLCGG